MAVYIEAGLIVVKDNYEAIVDNDLLPYNTPAQLSVNTFKHKEQKETTQLRTAETSLVDLGAATCKLINFVDYEV